jgi:hypothetical protein
MPLRRGRPALAAGAAAPAPSPIGNAGEVGRHSGKRINSSYAARACPTKPVTRAPSVRGRTWTTFAPPSITPAAPVRRLVTDLPPAGAESPGAAPRSPSLRKRFPRSALLILHFGGYTRNPREVLPFRGRSFKEGAAALDRCGFIVSWPALRPWNRCSELVAALRNSDRPYSRRSRCPVER